MSAADKPIPNPVVVLREEFNDWAVLFNPDTADAVGINPVGVAIWKLLDGEHTGREVLSKLKEQFANVPPTALEDLGAFIKQLAEGGFVGYELKAREK